MKKYLRLLKNTVLPKGYQLSNLKQPFANEFTCWEDWSREFLSQKRGRR